MFHPPFEDFHGNVAIFQDVGDELEACGLILNSSEFAPGVSYTFPIGSFEITDDDMYENVTLTHQLFLASAHGPSKVVVMLLFTGTNTGCATFCVQHQSDAWTLRADKAYRANSRFVELLSKVNMTPDKAVTVEEDRAIEVIHIMANYFRQLNRPPRALC